jgi:membrane protein implicated in regulation of membrane protease activity
MFLYIWIGVIILSFVIEAVSMDLLAVWFTIGGLAAFFANLLNASDTVQLVIFVLVSFGLLIFTRPLAKRYFKTNIIRTNADRVIGQKAIVVEPISLHKRGSVKVDGKEWTAVTRDNVEFVTDEVVEVLAIEGVKLIIRKD